MRKDEVEGLGETDDVERDRDRLGEKERDPYRTTDFQSQRARDEKIRATAAHALIGRNRRKRETGEQRDEVGDQENLEALFQARVAHHPAGAHKHDHAEDGEHVGSEDSAEGPELYRCGLRLRIFGHRWCHSQPMP